MKKIIYNSLLLLSLFLLVGCGDEVAKKINDPESKYSGNEMQCFREQDGINNRIWIFQDPDTYEIIRATLTEYITINIYDDDGNKIDVDVNKMFCDDYDKDTFNECVAVLTKSQLTGEKNNATVKYVYKNDVFVDDGFNTKNGLNDLKNRTEDDGYKCDIFMENN